MTVLKAGKTNKFIMLFSVITLISLLFSTKAVFASTLSAQSTNSESGYCYIIQDEANLLENCSKGELQELELLLSEISNECNIAFYTTSYNPYFSTDTLAEEKNEEFFGRNSNSIIFVIDMDYRNIYLDSMGTMKRYITKAHANTITDNTYRYASRADYYGCAYEALSEVHALLKGRRIAQPMKYISNALLAVILAMLINYAIVKIISARHKPSKQDLLSGMYHDLKVFNPSAHFMNSTKTYSPQSSGGGSSGGGGGHSGGGGGGGGGHSGGGHGF